MFCANLREMIARRNAWIAKWGIKQLREDYETATRRKN